MLLYRGMGSYRCNACIRCVLQSYKTPFHHPRSPRAREFDQFTVLCALLCVLVQEAAHIVSVILVHVAVCQRYTERAIDGEPPASLPSTRPRVSFSSVRPKDDCKGSVEGVGKGIYFRRGVGIHVAALEVGLGHSSTV